MELISVVIPVFNQRDNLERCLGTLCGFHSAEYSLEIILVDDGSLDGSGELCRKYILEYENIHYFYQENTGASAARNTGIRSAKGKYIFFLDADDGLKPGTIEKAAVFFDSVYDEVDMVTYPITTICNGRKLPPHFRYQYLTKSGVYDIRKYPYIGQTTMNIAVKNRFDDNLFFEDGLSILEDQKYCCDMLKEKKMLGFCSEGEYFYFRSPQSTSGKLSGSCYIFEQSMEFFEGLFAEYEEVPLAFQGLYVYDLYWKMCSNILFPYHYREPRYTQEVERIWALLKRCNADVIIKHPAMDFFEKYYFLRQMGKNTLQLRVGSEFFELLYQGKLLVREQSMEMVITKIVVEGTSVEIFGFLKSVCFQFQNGQPVFYAVENGGVSRKNLELWSSAHNYYQSNEPTQCFLAMTYRCDVSEIRRFHFEVEMQNRIFPVHYYFMPLTPFSHIHRRYTYKKGGLHIAINKKNEFHISKCKSQKKCRIWLYYDCKGVSSDNGMLQFVHDRKKKDGIKRYYVISDRYRQNLIGNRNEYVLFGSRKHQKLFLQAEKIITAYIEENNVIPFSPEKYDRYAGKFHFEVIYLQHGVLQIKMPWKYSREKIMADKVVVSTEQEISLWKQGGFRERDLWKCKMPRFDFLGHRFSPKKKILFAPSWRSYLVGENRKGEWERLDIKFLSSVYYRKIQDFINSPQLEKILEKEDYLLEVKLHPIFAGYQNLFKVTSSRVYFVEQTADESEYALFITDFSSWVYDFLYMQIPVLLFIPDYVEFKAGMNGYHELNENVTDWSQTSTEAGEVIDRIKVFFKCGRGMELYADFFQEECAREAIYKKLI